MKDKKSLYEAFKSKDPRFDGCFFVGIKTTGIYCRSICRAKLPKIENCTFYKTAAEAEKDGYRPCLLCKPENAPGILIRNSLENLANEARNLIEKNYEKKLTIKAIAEELGCSDRHLRRAFANEYNISPIQYLQTCRLLLAKKLLVSTDLPVFEIAKSSGFGSLRRFNDVFKKQYNLSPSNLRKENIVKNKNIELAISYRPPYCWDEILNFLKNRAIEGVELVKNNTYMRTVQIKNKKGEYVYGWIKVKNNFKKNNLAITISESLLSVIPQILFQLKKLFDTESDPYTIYDTLSSMNKINPNFCKLGIRLPGCFDIFEMITRAVIGQQISVKAANTIISRIVIAYGTTIETNSKELTHVFPSSDKILSLIGPIENHFGPLGVTSARANTIYELANLINKKEINFDSCNNIEEKIKKLMKIKGIGSWTAKYIAMRAVGWTDSFLETDIGIKKALKDYSEKEILKMSEKWSPWRSYATINLWNAL
ncbi:DNA-3-methyladenine glycosylase 2 family protein [Methanobrevibacter sp. DSM 116169]|uniref:DNA-3-methyladenine glycosylase 2 family protein n=1 Tax=Methanobrevibacter sp. DSM 116169 TaxID=3242727 RepID=UPI0038FC6BEE